MKIYITMVHNRHGEPQPYAFSTPEAAIAYARTVAEAYMRDGAEVETYRDARGYDTYSIEGDSVWVLEKTLDDPEAA